MKHGRPCCVSDVSVMGDNKALAIWFGSYSGEGLILTDVVEGLLRDSGRSELAGPVIVMRVIKLIGEREGPFGEVEMWVSNLEVVAQCE